MITISFVDGEKDMELAESCFIVLSAGNFINVEEKVNNHGILSTKTRYMIPAHRIKMVSFD